MELLKQAVKKYYHNKVDTETNKGGFSLVDACLSVCEAIEKNTVELYPGKELSYEESLKVLDTLKEQGLINSMEMDEIIAFVDELWIAK